MRNDEGRKLTDIELAELEKRIRESYGKAVDDLKEIIDDYFEKFQKRDAEMRKLIGKEANGRVWTEEDYKQWRLAQMGRGQRFEAMRRNSPNASPTRTRLPLLMSTTKRRGFTPSTATMPHTRLRRWVRGQILHCTMNPPCAALLLSGQASCRITRRRKP